MAYYTEEQIKQARSIDLLTYLQTQEPTELVKLKGNTYCTREHDSLKISNGKWYWWSRGFGGKSALDYLTKVKGLSFTDAMKRLTKEKPDLHNTDKKICRKPERDADRRLLLPERSETNEKIIKYLTRGRTRVQDDKGGFIPFFSGSFFMLYFLTDIQIAICRTEVCEYASYV